MINGAPKKYDLIIIGAGPAGGNAALSACASGLKVALIDENEKAGGQIWRAPSRDFKLKNNTDRDRNDGDDFRQSIQRLISKGEINFLSSTTVWSVESGFKVYAHNDKDGKIVLETERLLVATGAHERVVPFLNWTLPGVFGLAAATSLIKRDGVLPGENIVIAGQGPLLVAVVAKALAMGKKPLAVIDYSNKSSWLKKTIKFLNVPSVFFDGIKWSYKIAMAKVPWYFSHEIIKADGSGRLEKISFAKRLKIGEMSDDIISLNVDTLYVGNGLESGGEITKLLGAKHIYDNFLNGWTVEKDDFGRTTIDGLYAAGDASKIQGSLTAQACGRLAGLAIAYDADKIDEAEFNKLASPFIKSLKKLKCFATASCGLMHIDRRRMERLDDETTICRCEDVTKGEIKSTLNGGASSLTELKYSTRLGMGPCQGRMCLSNATDIIANEIGESAYQNPPSIRPPIRPISIEDLSGEFSYDDIPVPKPAPL